jgi:ArsR family metal-binding transcriptional regulator
MRKCHRAHKRLQIQQIASLPFDQVVVRLLEKMFPRAVVYDDKELRITFKVTPPMLIRLA